ncbi:MAG: NAD(P)-binding domain-containing protein, partial [Pseudomonadota bacterium]
MRPRTKGELSGEARMQTVGVVGLGSMGAGIAEALLRAGFQTHGFDVDPARMRRFQAKGGMPGTLAEVAPRLDALVIVVLNAAQMDEVLFGAEAIAEALSQGTVVIACPTVPPAAAQAMEARCQATGLHYLDAPISGGSVKAAAGQLSIMASGTAEAFTAARPALDAMAETVFELGDRAGPGSA